MATGFTALRWSLLHLSHDTMYFFMETVAIIRAKKIWQDRIALMEHGMIVCWIILQKTPLSIHALVNALKTAHVRLSLLKRLTRRYVRFSSPSTQKEVRIINIWRSTTQQLRLFSWDNTSLQIAATDAEITVQLHRSIS